MKTKQLLLRMLMTSTAVRCCNVFVEALDGTKYVVGESGVGIYSPGSDISIDGGQKKVPSIPKVCMVISGGNVFTSDESEFSSPKEALKPHYMSITPGSMHISLGEQVGSTVVFTREGVLETRDLGTLKPKGQFLYCTSTEWHFLDVSGFWTFQELGAYEDKDKEFKIFMRQYFQGQKCDYLIGSLQALMAFQSTVAEQFPWLSATLFPVNTKRLIEILPLKPYQALLLALGLDFLDKEALQESINSTRHPEKILASVQALIQESENVATGAESVNIFGEQSSTFKNQALAGFRSEAISQTKDGYCFHSDQFAIAQIMQFLERSSSKERFEKDLEFYLQLINAANGAFSEYQKIASQINWEKFCRECFEHLAYTVHSNKESEDDSFSEERMSLVASAMMGYSSDVPATIEFKKACGSVSKYLPLIEKPTLTYGRFFILVPVEAWKGMLDLAYTYVNAGLEKLADKYQKELLATQIPWYGATYENDRIGFDEWWNLVKSKSFRFNLPLSDFPAKKPDQSEFFKILLDGSDKKEGLAAYGRFLESVKSLKDPADENLALPKPPFRKLFSEEVQVKHDKDAINRFAEKQEELYKEVVRAQELVYKLALEQKNKEIDALKHQYPEGGKTFDEKSRTVMERFACNQGIISDRLSQLDEGSSVSVHRGELRNRYVERFDALSNLATRLGKITPWALLHCLSAIDATGKTSVIDAALDLLIKATSHQTRSDGEKNKLREEMKGLLGVQLSEELKKSLYPRRCGNKAEILEAALQIQKDRNQALSGAASSLQVERYVDEQGMAARLFIEHCMEESLFKAACEAFEAGDFKDLTAQFTEIISFCGPAINEGSMSPMFDFDNLLSLFLTGSLRIGQKMAQAQADGTAIQMGASNLQFIFVLYALGDGAFPILLLLEAFKKSLQENKDIINSLQDTVSAETDTDRSDQFGKVVNAFRDAVLIEGVEKNFNRDRLPNWSLIFVLLENENLPQMMESLASKLSSGASGSSSSEAFFKKIDFVTKLYSVVMMSVAEKAREQVDSNVLAFPVASNLYLVDTAKPRILSIEEFKRVNPFSELIIKSSLLEGVKVERCGDLCVVDLREQGFWPGAGFVGKFVMRREYLPVLQKDIHPCTEEQRKEALKVFIGFDPTGALLPLLIPDRETADRVAVDWCPLLRYRLPEAVRCTGFDVIGVVLTSQKRPSSDHKAHYLSLRRAEIESIRAAFKKLKPGDSLAHFVYLMNRLLMISEESTKKYTLSICTKALEMQQESLKPFCEDFEDLTIKHLTIKLEVISQPIEEAMQAMRDMLYSTIKHLTIKLEVISQPIEEAMQAMRDMLYSLSATASWSDALSSAAVTSGLVRWTGPGNFDTPVRTERKENPRAATYLDDPGDVQRGMVDSLDKIKRLYREREALFKATQGHGRDFFRRVSELFMMVNKVDPNSMNFEDDYRTLRERVKKLLSATEFPATVRLSPKPAVGLRNEKLVITLYNMIEGLTQKNRTFVLVKLQEKPENSEKTRKQQETDQLNRIKRFLMDLHSKLVGTSEQIDALEILQKLVTDDRHAYIKEGPEGFKSIALLPISAENDAKRIEYMLYTLQKSGKHMDLSKVQQALRDAEAAKEEYKSRGKQDFDIEADSDEKIMDLSTFTEVFSQWIFSSGFALQNIKPNDIRKVIESSYYSLLAGGLSLSKELARQFCVGGFEWKEKNISSVMPDRLPHLTNSLIVQKFGKDLFEKLKEVIDVNKLRWAIFGNAQARAELSKIYNSVTKLHELKHVLDNLWTSLQEVMRYSDAASLALDVADIPDGIVMVNGSSWFEVQRKGYIKEQIRVIMSKMIETWNRPELTIEELNQIKGFCKAFGDLMLASALTPYELLKAIRDGFEGSEIIIVSWGTKACGMTQFPDANMPDTANYFIEELKGALKKEVLLCELDWGKVVSDGVRASDRMAKRLRDSSFHPGMRRQLVARSFCKHQIFNELNEALQANNGADLYEISQYIGTSFPEAWNMATVLQVDDILSRGRAPVEPGNLKVLAYRILVSAPFMIPEECWETDRRKLNEKIRSSSSVLRFSPGEIDFEELWKEIDDLNSLEGSKIQRLALGWSQIRRLSEQTLAARIIRERLIPHKELMDTIFTHGWISGANPKDVREKIQKIDFTKLWEEICNFRHTPAIQIIASIIGMWTVIQRGTIPDGDSIDFAELSDYFTIFELSLPLEFKSSFPGGYTADHIRHKPRGSNTEPLVELPLPKYFEPGTKSIAVDSQIGYDLTFLDPRLDDDINPQSPAVVGSPLTLLALAQPAGEPVYSLEQDLRCVRRLQRFIRASTYSPGAGKLLQNLLVSAVSAYISEDGRKAWDALIRNLGHEADVFPKLALSPTDIPVIPAAIWHCNPNPIALEKNIGGNIPPWAAAYLMGAIPVLSVSRSVCLPSQIRQLLANSGPGPEKLKCDFTPEVATASVTWNIQPEEDVVGEIVEALQGIPSTVRGSATQYLNGRLAAEGCTALSGQGQKTIKTQRATYIQLDDGKFVVKSDIENQTNPTGNKAKDLAVLLLLFLIMFVFVIVSWNLYVAPALTSAIDDEASSKFTDPPVHLIAFEPLI